MHPNDQSEYHSPELQAKVRRIAGYLRFGIFLPLFVGLVFLIIGLLMVIDAFESGRLGYAPIAVPAIGVAIISFVLFDLKVASDFEKFRPWTYPWVEFLTRSSWRWGWGFGGIYSPEVRKAFHQPEFEYPDHPEYGYKIEEKK